MAFVVAAASIMGCVFVAAFGVARVEEATLERIEAQAPRIKRAAGWVLAGVGAWLLALAVFADRFAAVFPV